MDFLPSFISHSMPLFGAVMSMLHYRNRHMKPICIKKLQEAARRVDKSNIYRSRQTVISRHQFVSRIGEKVTSAQCLPQEVNDNQERKTTLDERSQLLKNMEDVRVRVKQHQDCNPANLQMTYRNLVCKYHCRTKRQNVPFFLPKFAA